MLHSVSRHDPCVGLHRKLSTGSSRDAITDNSLFPKANNDNIPGDMEDVCVRTCTEQNDGICQLL